MFNSVIAIMAAAMAASTNGTAPSEQPSAQATNQAVATQEKVEDKIVCRRITPTGTRLGGERVCKPKSWWDNVQKEAQKGLGEHQQRGMQANSAGSGI